MKQISKIFFLFFLVFTIKISAIDCPKDLLFNFTLPKQNESVNGAKQKVSMTTNVKEGLYYHLIQTNTSDSKKTQYLQSSGKIEGGSFSNYVWLGNQTQGKNSSFLVTAILSTKEIKKEGKVFIWNDKSLNPKEICKTSFITISRKD